MLKGRRPPRRRERRLTGLRRAPPGPRQEREQRLRRLVRRFFGQEVAAIDRAARHVVRPRAPAGEDVQRDARPAGAVRLPGAPQRQDGAGNAPAGGGVRRVVGGVERRRAVVLAHRMQGRGVAEATQILGEDGFGYRAGNGKPAVEQPAEVEFGLRAHQPLRQRRRLEHQQPVEIGFGHARVHARENVAGGRDVEKGEAGDAVRAVVGEAVGDPRAAVVAHDVEAVEPERRHRPALVLRHRPLGVGRVVGGGGRLAAVAVSAQVGGGDREPLRQPRRDMAPHEARLRVSVQE